MAITIDYEKDLIQFIDVDFSSIKTYEPVYSKQYDDGARFIVATVWKDGEEYTIPTDTQCIFCATKPSKLGVANHCEIINNKIVYQITVQTTVEHGVFPAEFRLYKTENGVPKVYSTPKFKMNVEKSALTNDTIMSTNEFNVLTELIEDATEAILLMNAAIVAEQNRVTVENVRVTNENTRKTNETNRVTAEASRVTVESARVTAENTRKTNETTRETNEALRKTNETTRGTNETSRVSAESSRTIAETNRGTQEIIRKTNETTRQDQETTRQNYYNAYKVLDNYSSTTNYIVGNKTKYKGSTYQNILDCIDVLPTVITNWICIASKGLDGTLGVVATEEEAAEGIRNDVVMTPYTVLHSISTNVQSGGGGEGGGGSVYVPTIESTFSKTLFVTGESLSIPVTFYTPNLGKGTLYFYIDNVLDQQLSITQGTTTLRKEGLVNGNHRVKIYVIDRAKQYTNELVFDITVGSLEITSEFNAEANYTISDTIKFPYSVSTISQEPVYLVAVINNQEYSIVSVKGWNTFTLPNLVVGVNKVTFKLVSGLYTSNILTYSIIIASSTELFISSDYAISTIEEGTITTVDFRISMTGQSSYNVKGYIDNVLSKEMTGKTGNNYWTISNLVTGNHTLKIEVATLTGTSVKYLTFPIVVTANAFEEILPVSNGLIASFKSKGKTNIDNDRAIWEDLTGNGYDINLINFNFSSNGWIDNVLKCNGNAYALLPLRPFMDNCPYGITIDVLFRTRDIGDTEGRVISCESNSVAKQGIYINTEKIQYNTSVTKMTVDIEEDVWTRATMVLSRKNKIVKLFVNGVLMNPSLLTDQGSVLESVASTEYMYLNASVVNGVAKYFGSCEIKSLSIYERDLDDEEVIQNYISGFDSREEQQKQYIKNYYSDLPVMHFYADTSVLANMTKDNKVPVRIKYLATEGFGDSFDLPECSVSWQGTSSIQYAVKNYKIRLLDASDNKVKINPFSRGKNESTFTLKADYMESSHFRNVGTAKFIEDNLYATKIPPAQLDSNVRTTIDGFPILLYVNDEFTGIYNFDNDKGNNDTFGLNTSLFPQCTSFEFASNSDSSAGAFLDDTMVSIKQDCELRYPNPEDVSQEVVDINYNKLKRIITWVKNASDATFASEFEQYFNKEYCIKYYIQVMLFGMVDNLGKNMMMTTWDGSIWYPTFYDLDTSLGLDNTGYIRIASDVEVQAGSFNTSASALWTKLARVFASDIATDYYALRNSTYTPEKVLAHFSNYIKDIGERHYNLDCQNKYIQFGNTYLFMAHGNDYPRLRRWVMDRFVYVDTLLGYTPTTAKSITIRANKKGTVTFKIQTYCSMYITVVWRNGVETRQKVKKGEIVTFSSSLPTATDQEILIYGADYLKDIGELSVFNPTSIQVGNATRLVKLVCVSASALLSVSVDKNLFLQEINLGGCASLGSVEGSKILDISKCENLKYLNIMVTALTGLNTNVDGNNLVEMYISSGTLSNLHIINMVNLETVVLNANTSLPGVTSFIGSGSSNYKLYYINNQYMDHLTYRTASKYNYDLGNLVSRSGSVSLQDYDFGEGSTIHFSQVTTNIDLKNIKVSTLNVQYITSVAKISILNSEIGSITLYGSDAGNYLSLLDLSSNKIGTLKTSIGYFNNRVIIPDSLENYVNGSSCRNIKIHTIRTEASFDGIDFLGTNIKGISLRYAKFTALRYVGNLSSPLGLDTNVDLSGVQIDTIDLSDPSKYLISSLDYACAYLSFRRVIMPSVMPATSFRNIFYKSKVTGTTWNQVLAPFKGVAFPCPKSNNDWVETENNVTNSIGGWFLDAEFAESNNVEIDFLFDSPVTTSYNPKIGGFFRNNKGLNSIKLLKIKSSLVGQAYISCSSNVPLFIDTVGNTKTIEEINVDINGSVSSGGFVANGITRVEKINIYQGGGSVITSFTFPLVTYVGTVIIEGTVYFYLDTFFSLMPLCIEVGELNVIKASEYHIAGANAIKKIGKLTMPKITNSNRYGSVLLELGEVVMTSRTWSYLGKNLTALTKISKMELMNGDILTYVFYSDNNILTTIEQLTLPADQNLTLFSLLTKLTLASLTVIINALPTVGVARTLTLSSASNTLLTAELKALAVSKGWTIVV